MNTYKIIWQPEIVDQMARFGDPAARPYNIAETYPNNVKADRFEIVTENSFYDVRFYVGDEMILALVRVPVSVEKVVDELQE